MKCFECGAGMHPGTVDHTFTISDVKVHGHLPAMICDDKCGESTVDGNDVVAFDLAAASLLARHGVRTGEVFKFMRKTLGKRAVDISELLRTNPATISKWERGHAEVDAHAFALLAALIEDRINGKTGTEERLKVLANPPKVFPRELEVSAA